jgi:hypothetical protein
MSLLLHVQLPRWLLVLISQLTARMILCLLPLATVDHFRVKRRNRLDLTCQVPKQGDSILFKPRALELVEAQRSFVPANAMPDNPLSPPAMVHTYHGRGLGPVIGLMSFVTWTFIMLFCFPITLARRPKHLLAKFN